MMKHTAKQILAGLLVLSAVAAQAAPYVILQNGQRKIGSAIRASSNGDIRLTLENGQTLTYTRSQVKQAVADKPGEFDQALAAIQSDQLDRAVTLLNSVIRQYRYLGWDERAIPLLAQVFMKKEDFSQAISTFDKAFKNNPDLQRKPEVVAPYWDALLQTEQFGKLEEMLSDMIANGPRDGAARAQIVRGDIKKSRGQTEDAVIDYLRTVVFFKQQVDVLPEALYKAGETLALLRDPRSDTMFNTLVKEYPNTEWAQKARAKM